MNKMKNKSITITIIIIFVILFLLFVLLYHTVVPYGDVPDINKWCPYEKEIVVLNESFPSDIIIFGDDVLFNNKLKYRNISELSESTLTSGPEYKYSFLVINDSSGQLKITDDEFALCKKRCDDNNMNFIYIGDQYIEHFNDFGFYRELYSDDLKGIAYLLSLSFGHSDCQGFWTTKEIEVSKNNPGLLGQIMVYLFVNCTINELN